MLIRRFSSIRRIVAAFLVTFAIGTAIGATGCASFNRADPIPSSLTGIARTVYRADEVGVLLGSVQHAAIELNKITECDAEAKCTALLSDRNRRVIVNVITPTLVAMDALPSGYLTLTQSAIEQINAQLDSEGRDRMRPYFVAIQVAVGIAVQSGGQR